LIKAIAGLGMSNPTLAFRTEGLNAPEPSGFLERLILRILAFAEWLNVRCSKVGSPCVYDKTLFPWVANIEPQWGLIRSELDQLLVRKDELACFHEIASEVTTISQDTGWKTFLLTAYGLDSEQNIKLCPQTWRIVQNVPDLVTAMFSIFEPGKHLRPHRGPYNGVLRFHLGVLVPEPRDEIAIRVGSEVCHWEEGRALIFDDAYEHEAWNHSDKPRVVLFVDFVKPLRFPANLVNWLVLHLAVFAPAIREGAERQRAWERRFHGKS
jgi:ornithine lipid ester-linked acyl 2-hydroxylase